MRELHLRLRRLEPVSSREFWRETFFFMASFLATIVGTSVLLNHAAAVLV